MSSEFAPSERMARSNKNKYQGHGTDFGGQGIGRYGGFSSDAYYSGQAAGAGSGSGNGGRSGCGDPALMSAMMAPTMREREGQGCCGASSFAGRILVTTLMTVGKSCVSAYEVGTFNKPQYVVKSDCSESDDSSQLFQWCELVEVPGKDGKTTLYLQFVGVPKGEVDSGDFNGLYALVKRSGTISKGESSVDATWVGVDYLYGRAVTNSYQLLLS
ncbi:hypothetical protein CF326_g3383 [Tilletia indica]|nr:hypothetical protein CF326_g3383 [Tilletia indica]